MNKIHEKWTVWKPALEKYGMNPFKENNTIGLK